LLNHPWERAWIDRKPIDWESEPAFSRIQWLPTASGSWRPPPPASSAGTP
jgi:hypothetical protein